MATTYGNVLNIQRYSVNDGPGIRTTLFLKGCPLRCWWCHNPESQAWGIELAINQDLCVQCGGCWSVCPHNESPAEAVADECSGPLVDWQHCSVCGSCVEVCPTAGRTLMGQQLSVDQVMTEVRKDLLFFEESGGGVTLSGGEPMSQPLFVRELVNACQDQAISVAIDTSGFCDQHDLLSIAPQTDLFLYDLKVLDDQLHRQHTGVSNAKILDNLVALGQVHSGIWIRVPVVTGVNDSAGELESLARFVSTVRGVVRVDLLAYHPLGSHKHQRIGKQATHNTTPVPTSETMEYAKELFHSFGV